MDAFTTSCNPPPGANNAMINSGAFPNVTFKNPPMPGPQASCKLLGGAAHQCSRVDDTKRRRGKDQDRVCMDQLQQNRDRDQRHEQIRPAFPVNRSECFVVASGVCVVTFGSSRLYLDHSHRERIPLRREHSVAGLLGHIYIIRRCESHRFQQRVDPRQSALS